MYVFSLNYYVNITNSLPVELKQRIIGFSLQESLLYPLVNNHESNNNYFEYHNQWAEFIDVFKFASNRKIPLIDLSIVDENYLKIIIKLQPDCSIHFTTNIYNLTNLEFLEYLKNFEVNTLCLKGRTISSSNILKFKCILELVFKELKPSEFELQCLDHTNIIILEQEFIRETPIVLGKFYLYSALQLYKRILKLPLIIKSVTLLSLQERVSFCLDVTKAFLASDNVGHVFHVLEGLEMKIPGLLELIDQYKEKLSFKLKFVVRALNDHELKMIRSASEISTYIIAKETLDHDKSPENIILHFNSVLKFQNIKELLIDIDPLEYVILKNNFLKKLTIFSKNITNCSFKNLTNLKVLAICDFSHHPKTLIDKESLKSIPNQITTLKILTSLLIDDNENDNLDNIVVVPYSVKNFSCLSFKELKKFDFSQCIFPIKYDLNNETQTNETDSIDFFWRK